MEVELSRYLDTKKLNKKGTKYGATLVYAWKILQKLYAPGYEEKKLIAIILNPQQLLQKLLCYALYNGHDSQS
jgi:hypothetical protein